ncbi:MAG: glycosyltransferase family 2 protein [Promicromonosporaceae bacterium]|nr:glycosyltransferase family 2 protein [Promicromonosporaceae bacterium]
MKLVVTLLVRDEVDVVGANIAHHLDQGAAHVLVTDLGSTDGTVEIIESYARRGLATLIQEPGDEFRQAQWVTAMARRAATEHGADWVINLDGDEFWVPKDRSRRLVDVLAELPDEVGMVRAWRQDLVGFPSRGAGFTDWPRRLRWRNLNTVSERGRPLGPKVCHRADSQVEVPMGNHSAAGPRLGRLADDEPILILHAQLRSWAQFSRKIAVGGAALAANTELDAAVGWHWRADYERLQDGTLERTYRDRCLSVGRLLRGLRAGTLVRDRWLEKRLAQLPD